jgi:polyferredoxin
MNDNVMIMQGIPTWMFFSGVALILSISFFLVEILNRGNQSKKEYFKFDFLSIPWIKSWVKKPYFKFLFQFPVFLVFCFIIYAGIFGHGIVNIAPILTWTIWWTGLIFLILFFGKAWCFVCPWDFVATLFQHFKPFGVVKKPFTIGLKPPKWLRNIYPAIILFILLTWFELGFKITGSPRLTAVAAILMVVCAVVPALIFEKRWFCKHACLVGRIQGLYANFAPVEIRAKQLSVCGACKTKDCYAGNDKGNPCPTELTMPAVMQNTYCILCTECIKTCPHDNIAVNLRPFGTDLKRFKKVTMDESVLALVLLALTSFHGITMTPLWDSLTQPSIISRIQDIFGVGQLSAFTIGMAGIMGILFLFYYGISAATRLSVKDKTVPVKRIFLHFSFSLLPIALFYHLAHNVMHLAMEGGMIIPLLSDPLGRGDNFFGTAYWPTRHLLSENVMWITQVVLVLAGHIYGIIIAHHVARKLYSDTKDAMRSLVPMLVGMIFYSFVSLWIMHLDMNMRSSLM